MRIAVTGQSGTLSRELQKLQSDIRTLESSGYDIADPLLTKKLALLDLDVIIHAGAITNSAQVIADPSSAIKVNIIGTANIANHCIQHSIRLVYISTDYIYPGVSGDYKETDPILPHNLYAWTKLGGECSVRLVPNHLIIRTSFGSSKYPHKSAWTNQLVSKDYVDIIAPRILRAARSKEIGFLNVGTEPKTLFDYAQKRNTVEPAVNATSYNFSLSTTRYEQLYGN